METIFIVEKRIEYIVKAIADRDYSHDNGLCHTTSIIVPFVADGVDAGKWIPHDRTSKLWAKYWEKQGVMPQYSKSYNLIGGHCKAEDIADIGKPISNDTLQKGAQMELGEELKKRDPKGSKSLEVWDSGGHQPNKDVKARDYNALQLIPIGFAEYESKTNREASFVCALPVPSGDLDDDLISADDYKGQDKKTHDVYLPLELKTEAELRELHKNSSDTEVCDAITRLWESQNQVVHDKLLEEIQKYTCRKAKP